MVTITMMNEGCGDPSRGGGSATAVATDLCFSPGGKSHHQVTTKSQQVTKITTKSHQVTPNYTKSQ